MIKNKQEYQFYFYSLLKKKILRKKQDKMSSQFAIDFAKKNSEKEIPKSMILIKYKWKDDNRAEIRIITP